MLQSIRDRTQGWIAGIIISLLILSFALWGIHSYFMGNGVSTIVAEVNGVDITKGQLAIAYERLRREAQTPNDELSANTDANLKERALQALINIQVLKQASIQQDYYISPLQVDGYLENMPEFQVNNQFSLARFQQALASTMYTPIEFLDLIKTSLLIEQPRLGTIFSSFALPNEVDETIALINQERDITYIIFPHQSFSNTKVNVSEEMIKKYYTEHQDEFRTPEQVSVKYIELSVKDLLNKIKPTDAELKTFYNENIHVFAKPAAKAMDGKEAQFMPFDHVKDKVNELYVHQKAQELFAQTREKLANLTYQYPESLDSASKALDLPIKETELFTMDKGFSDISSDKKVREAAFSNDVLTLQNNSDIIQKSADSVIVIRIKSHVPSALLSLNAVQSQIADKLKSVEIDAKAQSDIRELSTKLNNGANPEDLVKPYQLTWKDIGFIARHATKVDSAILTAAFEMPKPTDNHKVTYVVAKVPNGYAIIGLKGVKDGKASGSEEYEVYAEQAQNTQGLLEYGLYKLSAMSNAKIVNK